MFWVGSRSEGPPCGAYKHIDRSTCGWPETSIVIGVGAKSAVNNNTICQHSPHNREYLRTESDGSVIAGEIIEFWGNAQNGSANNGDIEWRVHIVTTMNNVILRGGTRKGAGLAKDTGGKKTSRRTVTIERKA